MQCLANLGLCTGSEFDTASATSLYWKTVPTLLRLADRNEHTSELSLRILTGNIRGNHRSRVRVRAAHMHAHGNLMYCTYILSIDQCCSASRNLAAFKNDIRNNRSIITKSLICLTPLPSTLTPLLPLCTQSVRYVTQQYMRWRCACAWYRCCVYTFPLSQTPISCTPWKSARKNSAL